MGRIEKDIINNLTETIDEYAKFFEEEGYDLSDLENDLNSRFSGEEYDTNAYQKLKYQYR